MDDDLALAHRLADIADDLTGARFRSKDYVVKRKQDGSVVTDADVQVEEALANAVAEHRPPDSFLGEEVGLRERGAARTWIVDGIDGTSAFVSGGSTWGTLVALQEHGEIVVGLTSSPGLRARWWAARGRGAWTRRFGPPGVRRVRRLTVMRRASHGARCAVVLPPPGVLRGWRDESVRHVVRSLRPTPNAGHGPLLVATGDIEASVHLWGGPWDHAPFVVLVEEAGGKFSDLWGARRLDTATAVFTNGQRHDEIRALACTPAPDIPEIP
jgi:histidinol-phosphatase